ncbi:MAG TPA: hypothetical protein VGR51_03560 [Thermoplasmata archaeon]|nr:hypothetical protein [Thermoplasmata archaeon]
MVIPTYAPWAAAGIAVGALLVVLYRRRVVEWIFLVNNGGVLVASVARRQATTLDTDLMTGMLTAIMNFTRDSFSDEQKRELDYFAFGDRRVELVQGERAYLAAVYAGRTRGNLERNMKAVLAHIEASYPKALDDVVDQDSFLEIPVLLQRFMERAWWPVQSFDRMEGLRSA